MRESFGRKSDEQVRETIAEILATEISDPRVMLVTVATISAIVSATRSSRTNDSLMIGLLAYASRATSMTLKPSMMSPSLRSW